LLAVGCGASTRASVTVASPPPPACHRVAPAHGEAATTITVGELLCLPALPPGESVADDAPTVLAPAAAKTGEYVARTAGTAMLSFTRRPVCSPGAACPQFVVLVGRLTVRVVKAG
jgi:hypothetical protein